MSEIRAFIVDDEPLARRGIRNQLARHVDVRVLGESANAREAMSALETLSPDVIFLDVAMPEMTGFDLLAQLGDRPPVVVFVTAFDRYASRAFDVKALDYVVKPINAQRF